MPRDLEREKTVLTLGAGADIMNHLVPALACERIADDPNMRHPTR